MAYASTVRTLVSRTTTEVFHTLDLEHLNWDLYHSFVIPAFVSFPPWSCTHPTFVLRFPQTARLGYVFHTRIVV
jgi:hypothetical protein